MEVITPKIRYGQNISPRIPENTNCAVQAFLERLNSTDAYFSVSVIDTISNHLNLLREVGKEKYKTVIDSVSSLFAEELKRAKQVQLFKEIPSDDDEDCTGKVTRRVKYIN